MQQLLALLKKKPHWLAHEGYWRLLQILRMVAFVPLAVFGIVCLGAGVTMLTETYSNSNDMFAMGLLCLAGSMAAFVAVHGSAWLLVWVIAGFSEAKKS